MTDKILHGCLERETHRNSSSGLPFAGHVCCGPLVEWSVGFQHKQGSGTDLEVVGLFL